VQPLGQGLGANAFLKMYGDKTKGHKFYIAKNADGYVRKMLDVGGESAYIDCIKDEESQLIEGK
jgi:hypothetical protein